MSIPAAVDAALACELLRSPAWQSLGLNARRALDCLIAMALSPNSTGVLEPTGADFRAFGVSRPRQAIDNLVEVGLVEVDVRRRDRLTLRLTFLDREAANPAWRSTTLADVLRMRSERALAGRRARSAQT